MLPLYLFSQIASGGPHVITLGYYDNLNSVNFLFILRSNQINIFICAIWRCWESKT